MFFFTSKDMKKFLLLIALPIAFLSCNSFQKEAKKQMVSTLLANAKLADPDAEVSNINTVFSSDSLIIIHCKLHGPRNNGWNFDIEYLYLLQADGSRRETSFEVNHEPSVIYKAAVYRKNIKEQQGIILDSIDAIKKVALWTFPTR